jgi:hypothetical protein
MILVAVLAFGLWAGLLWSRSRSYRIRGEAFAACHARNITESLYVLRLGQRAQRRIRESGDPETIMGLKRQMDGAIEQSRGYNLAADWCAEMEVRYRVAARQPWRSVHEGTPPRTGGVPVFLPSPR